MIEQGGKIGKLEFIVETEMHHDWVMREYKSIKSLNNLSKIDIIFKKNRVH